MRWFVLALLVLSFPARAETPEEWIALGTRVHGGFGSFIPLGIKIGLDANEKLKTAPRGLMVVYHDSDKSPCACFADGVALATYASFGQRSVVMSPDKAPDGSIAVIEIRPRQGGAGFKYTIPASSLTKLGPMNQKFDPRGRWDALMKEDGLYSVEPLP